MIVGKLASSIDRVGSCPLVARVDMRTVLGLSPCSPCGLRSELRGCSWLVELESCGGKFGVAAVGSSNSVGQSSICSVYLSPSGAEVWLHSDLSNCQTSDIALSRDTGKPHRVDRSDTRRSGCCTLADGA